MSEKMVTGCCLESEQREALHKKLGRELHEEVWSHSMTGHRILVCPEPVSDRYKGILYKPRSAQEREGLEMGAGWIIAAGPLAGSDIGWYPGGLLCDEPEELLGLHVIFKSHSGVTLKTNEDDEEFQGKHILLVLTTRDILAIGEGL